MTLGWYSLFVMLDALNNPAAFTGLAAITAGLASLVKIGNIGLELWYNMLSLFICYMKGCFCVSTRHEREEREKKGCDQTLSFTYINNLSHFSSHFCIIMIIIFYFFFFLPLWLIGVQRTYLIALDGKGETNLAKPTADGVREPLNRRATIDINF